MVLKVQGFVGGQPWYVMSMHATHGVADQG